MTRPDPAGEIRCELDEIVTRIGGIRALLQDGGHEDTCDLLAVDIESGVDRIRELFEALPTSEVKP